MKQQVSFVVLTILAVISGIWSIINMLRYLGFSPVSPLGLLEIFKVNIIGAIFSGLTAVIWFWAAGKLLNLELQGLVFVVFVAVVYLIFDFIAILGGASIQALAISILLSGSALILARCQKLAGLLLVPEVLTQLGVLVGFPPKHPHVLPNCVSS